MPKKISAAERKRLNRQIKNKHEILRKRYREVHGKTVDWITHLHEDGACFLDVRFTDRNELLCNTPPSDRDGRD